MAQATILGVAGTLLGGLFAEVIPLTLFWFIPWAMFWIICLVTVIATSTLAVDIHHRLITHDFESTFFEAFDRSMAHGLSVIISGFVTAAGFLITCSEVSHRAYISARQAQEEDPDCVTIGLGCLLTFVVGHAILVNAVALGCVLVAGFRRLQGTAQAPATPTASVPTELFQVDRNALEGDLAVMKAKLAKLKAGLR
ncbi:hypothetical protein LTR56_017268 [Elasticomyces elasticus]|nr:hypothetical protein LTR56_017268 [Elasticomyces elasticus]KAK3639432.1 hypothetical protein LTR22_017466 [Elasticomyces elasticus]KAK4924616.1 hypothetical protein LTR49_008299 [Elasticomyces elasticus]KAK5763035.1 hypothetical protein LTS12_006819 [Elasticomyces elasticus]